VGQAVPPRVPSTPPTQGSRAALLDNSRVPSRQLPVPFGHDLRVERWVTASNPAQVCVHCPQVDSETLRNVSVADWVFREAQQTERDSGLAAG
jgi:hypothetical protein